MKKWSSSCCSSSSEFVWWPLFGVQIRLIHLCEKKKDMEKAAAKLPLDCTLVQGPLESTLSSPAVQISNEEEEQLLLQRQVSSVPSRTE
jgi:hypothetical protein